MEFEDHTEKSVKPFVFKGLKKLTRRDLEVENALLSYLPFSSEVGLKKSLEEFLEKQFNQSVNIELEKFEESMLSQFASSVPPVAWVAALGMQPVSQKAYVWFDAVLAHSLVDRVLGGGGEAPTELKSPTSIEEGVFQYLVLKALSFVAQISGSDQPILFRLEQILKSQKDLSSVTGEDAPVVRLNFRIQVGSTLGFVVVVLPHPLIEAGFLKRDFRNVSQMSPEYQYAQARFEKMAYVRTQLWAEVASVSLSLSEKNQLEKDDVILFDQSSCHLSGGQLQGNVILRIGEGREGGFLAQVISTDSPSLVKILDYYGGE